MNANYLNQQLASEIQDINIEFDEYTHQGYESS